MHWFWKKSPRRGVRATCNAASTKRANACSARINRDDCVIALDERGSAWSSVVLSQKLAGWRQDGRDVVLLVGGADGLSDSCMARATGSWSLSAATLPHALVRVVVAEQIYRAWTLLTGHPYHRE